MFKVIFLVAFHLYFAISWVVNAYQFFTCDFNAPYKEEIVHGLGLIIPYLSTITVWI